MKIFRTLLLIGLLVLLGLSAVFAFHWRYYHDSPIFFYIGMLIDKFGIIPYRDLYDINMPGTYLICLIIGRLTGFSVLSVRLLDYFFLAVIIFLGWLWIRKLSGWAGLAGGIAWALVYFMLGPTTMMQREYLMVIPILCGLAAYTNIPSKHAVWRFLISGLFLGISSMIKPQAFIGLLPILAVEWHSAYVESDPLEKKKLWAALRRMVLWLGIGFLVPWVLILIYLAVHGALPMFLEIIFDYLPLFAQMNEYHQVVIGGRRIIALVLDYGSLGGYGIWLAPALLGMYMLHQSATIPGEKKRLSELLFGLVAAFSIYPVFSGQFFPQHWLPFAFFLFQAAFLCLTVRVESRNAFLRLLPAAVMLVACISLVRPDTFDNLWMLLKTHELPAANDPKEGRVDEIAGFLEANLHPGDTVQPLDWVGGAVHAMLIAKVKIATPFIYDEYFYHNVNSAYIIGLRKRFMDDLQLAMPRFVVEVYDDGPYSEPTGPNTSRDFPELRSFLAQDYSVVKEGPGYRIYELR